MKSKGNGHHKIGYGGSGLGITPSDHAATGINSPGGEFLVFDAVGADAPATEATSNKKSNRRRRIITGIILMLLLVVAVALYFGTFGNSTPLNLRVHDTKAQENKTQTKPQNPDEITAAS